MQSDFTEDYYLRGKEAGLSNYENYRWLPDQTIPMAEALVKFMRLDTYDSILDFGCARGYLVRALNLVGTASSYGYDSSKWAIDNCDEEVKECVYNELPDRKFDFIVAKDVLEHIPRQDLIETIEKLIVRVSKDILIIVPLADAPDGKYFREEDEQDVTHKIRWTFDNWLNFLQDVSKLTVLGTTHIEGLKPASKQYPGSTGFFLIKK